MIAIILADTSFRDLGHLIIGAIIGCLFFIAFFSPLD